MKEKITATFKHQKLIQDQDRLKPELERALRLFESQGFATHKGTNSYVLANIMVDYIDRVLGETADKFDQLNFWKSQDLNVVARIAFENYRIYNTRTTTDTFHVDNNGWPYGTKLPNGLCYIGGNLGHISDPKVQSFTRYSLRKPVRIDVSYAELIAHSRVEVIGSKIIFEESFLDEDGSYIEMDYVIIPGEDGYAYMHPTAKMIEAIKGFKDTQSFNLVVFVKTSNPIAITSETLHKRGIEVTSDFLRFLTTELFAKFKILNRMSIKSLQRFLWVKYHKPSMISGSKIIIDLDDLNLEDLESFANRNLRPPGPKFGNAWETLRPKTLKIEFYDIECLGELKKHLESKLNMVETHRNLQNLVIFETEEFLRNIYGIEWKDIKAVKHIEPLGDNEFCILDVG